MNRTAEAVLLDWDGLLASSPVRARSRVARRLSALCNLGANIVILADAATGHVAVPDHAGSSARGRWLCAPATTLTGVVTTLAGSGIGASLSMLIATESFTEQTPPRLWIEKVAATSDGVPVCELLDEQIQRRTDRRVPAVDDDPAWIIREDSDNPLRQRIAEAICTIGAAGIGTRGAAEEPIEGTVPLVLGDGVYRGRTAEELLRAPEWTRLEIEPVPTRNEWILDLRSGLLLRQACGPAVTVRTLRLASIVRPGVMALRAEVEGGRLRSHDALHRPEGTPWVQGSLGGDRMWARSGPPDGPGVAAVAAQRFGRRGRTRTAERVAAFVVDRHRQPVLDAARAAVDAAVEDGFETVLAEHRAAWAKRWSTVNVEIPDDPATELAIRFALFQLWCNVSRHDESAVGARGLSGSGYAGHVFWDADVFVLPAMVSIDPQAAVAMLGYRRSRLDAACRRAAALGYAGARFPWESAATGDDVTPSSGVLGGVRVPILTGQQEEHITADVAWAAAYCARWLGSDSPEHQANYPVLIETARYWASRCRLDAEGRAHIDTVIGPDEYHESVDDNAFTNVMARWNLRAGAAALERSDVPSQEAQRWRDLADRMVDGYDVSSGRYEQFAGYFGLEPLLLADFAAPPVAADLLIGRDRVRGSQIIKQPDVLMLHHLVPEEIEPGSLAPNLDFYEPRTAHGSSLSPGVSAALLARVGRPDEALEMLRLALTLDLGDTTGMTAAGLHLANLAGIWQAVLTGFAGVGVDDDTLVVDPRLPHQWRSLELRFQCLGRRVRLELTSDDAVTVHSDGPLRARIVGGSSGFGAGPLELVRAPMTRPQGRGSQL